ncbi:hypothetical protein FOZ61_003690 [Perkinsus olseni]|uniref:SET domain-containing protein n=1 Tax=Perkinsus olseni TaxID=32597 RepID=A0A7J6LNM7_PEROL|nr:hypothetical protein FOZ61_003690 [Perkinsus olseni]KAF4673766.1 hypothetical protein FOL46_006466 [Perkinsus olseni]
MKAAQGDILCDIADVLADMSEAELLETWKVMKKIRRRVGEAPEERHAQILRHLRDGPVVKLGVSRIHGVGVFAVTAISSGVDPFRAAVSEGSKGSDDQYEIVSDKELLEVSPEVRELCFSFFAPFTATEDDYSPEVGEDGKIYPVNATGLNTLDVSWYLNHSECHPNVELVEPKGPGEFNTYRTKRDIQAGTELTIDYHQLGEAYYNRVIDASVHDAERRASRDDQ